jgi:hypothetical protein
MYLSGTNTLGFATNGTLDMTLDANGNLGLGVTPSAWNAGGKAIEIGMIGSAHWGLDQTSTYRTTNAYWNSGWKYGGTGQAANYAQEAGYHYWSTAPSGTAGNAITFTQAMTLNASGNLSIGNTNDTYKLDVTGTGRFTSRVLAGNSIFIGEVVSSFSLLESTSGNGIWLRPAGGSDPTGLKIATTGAATFSSSIQTGAPANGTAQPWKLGNAVSGTVSPSHYLVVEINGQSYTINAFNGFP